MKAKNEKIIVLDVDGVILDYNSAYLQIYEKSFGIKAKYVGVAYHAHNQYQFHEMTKQEKILFYRNFANHGWASMPPLEGAIQALDKLKQMGFEIYCVTSVPAQYQKHRKKNLEQLGNYFSDIICCGRDKNSDKNPKKIHIEKINPNYFVDDLLDNFKDIENSTQFVFIEKDAWDSPNFNSPIKYHLKHNSLLEFAEALEQNHKLIKKVNI